MRIDIHLQEHCLRVQQIIEQNNLGGLTRQQIATAEEGPPPSDPKQRADYLQRIEATANEGFDEVRQICRGFFEAGIEGWGFIWSRQVGREWYYHVIAKVIDAKRTPIIDFYPVRQIEQRWQKEYATRTRSVARIEVAHVRALEAHARALPAGPERTAMLAEVTQRLNAVEVRNLRLEALNMDGGMRFEDFEQLASPRDRRLRIFSRQTKNFVEAQKKANKELMDLVEMYEVFKQILNKDPRELGEGAARLDRAKP